MKVIAKKVFRTGVQTLLQSEDKFFVSIKNRTYYSIIEIPLEKVCIWKDLLK